MRSGLRYCGLWTVILALMAPLGLGRESGTHSPLEYRLRFFHTHTHQRLDIVGEEWVTTGVLTSWTWDACASALDRSFLSAA